MSYSLSSVAHAYALSSSQNEEARRAATTRRSGYPAVFCLCRTWVPSAQRKWLARLLRSTLHNLRDHYQVPPKHAVPFEYDVSLAVVKKIPIASTYG